MKEEILGDFHTKTLDRLPVGAAHSFAATGTPTSARSPGHVLPAIAIGIAPGQGSGHGRYRRAVRVQDRKIRLDRLNTYFAAVTAGEVEVVSIGKLKSHMAGGRWYRRMQRPLRPGCSIGHYQVGAGTLGCFVTPVEPGPVGTDYILSNNHVLADCNRGTLGDSIYQPGQLDAGRDGLSEVGRLAKFIPIISKGDNTVDCAYAVLNRGVTALPGSLGTDRTLRGLGSEYDTNRVYKIGRTSGLTEGIITAFEVDQIDVDMPTGAHRFVNQIEISGLDKPFSKPGDSGSLVFDDHGLGIGMIFAGTDAGGSLTNGVAYANPLGRVLDQLNVRLVV